MIEEPFPTLPSGHLLDNHHLSFKFKLKDVKTGDLLLSAEEWTCILMYVFIPFFTDGVIALSLFSFGNEDTIFDPGIILYSFILLTIPRLYLVGVELSDVHMFLNTVNESPIEIGFPHCFPKDK